MSSRRVEVYFLRFAEVANTCLFAYVAWLVNTSDSLGPRSRAEVALVTSVHFLAIVPFLLAFVVSFRKEIAPLQWLLIRAVHQALAIVTIALTLIFLVGLPDTAPAAVYVAVLALLQVAALKAIKQFALGASAVRLWPIRVFRVSMVFLFGFLFLLMK